MFSQGYSFKRLDFRLTRGFLIHHQNSLNKMRFLQHPYYFQPLNRSF